MEIYFCKIQQEGNNMTDRYSSSAHSSLLTTKAASLQQQPRSHARSFSLHPRPWKPEAHLWLAPAKANTKTSNYWFPNHLLRADDQWGEGPLTHGVLQSSLVTSSQKEVLYNVKSPANPYACCPESKTHKHTVLMWIRGDCLSGPSAPSLLCAHYVYVYIHVQTTNAHCWTCPRGEDKELPEWLYGTCV